MAGYFELSNAAGGQFKFNLKAANHQVILSSELYATKSAGQGGIASVQKNAASDTRYDRRTAKDGAPYFVLKAANGEIIGKSEMYSSASAMENGIASVKTNAPTAGTNDLTG